MSGRWTNSRHASNSSPLFNNTVTAITRIIRDGAHDLLNGRAEGVARAIVGHMAHADDGPWPALRRAMRKDIE
jgi:hypothetical protein